MCVLQSHTVKHVGTGTVASSKWGEVNNMPLETNKTYQFAITQIIEYCGVYNADILLSLPFNAKQRLVIAVQFNLVHTCKPNDKALVSFNTFN